MMAKFILALAFLIGATMTPGFGHAQDQSSPTSKVTSTAKSAKNKASKAAKKGAKGTAAAGNKAAEQTGEAAKGATNKAATGTKNAAGNGATATKSAANHVTGTQSATPPSPGMVWVNTNTKMYHKAGSQYYGKTKSGKWMTEADAQKAGYKAASK